MVVCGRGASIFKVDKAKQEHWKSDRHVQWEKAHKSMHPLNFFKAKLVEISSNVNHNPNNNDNRSTNSSTCPPPSCNPPPPLHPPSPQGGGGGGCAGVAPAMVWVGAWLGPTLPTLLPPFGCGGRKRAQVCRRGKPVVFGYRAVRVTDVAPVIVHAREV